MNRNYQISIIIATYNAGKTLQRCLDSIAAEKSENIELLIIDGKSKDNTLDIIKKNKSIINCWLSETDKGIYDAWNKGIKLAKGKWIMFLGADDILLEGSMSFYLDYLRHEQNLEECDIVFGRCWLMNDKGRRLRIMGDEYRWEKFRHYMKQSHGSALHNRKLFDEIGLFSSKFHICADYEFLLRKKLNAKYVNREIIAMQIGGLSNTIAGLIDTFRVKQYRKSASTFINAYYLIKGISGYYYKKYYLNRKECQ